MTVIQETLELTEQELEAYYWTHEAARFWHCTFAYFRENVRLGYWNPVDWELWREKFIYKRTLLKLKT